MTLKVLHLMARSHGKCLKSRVYKMGGAVLGRTTKEKNIGVTFSADKKVSEQCGIAASKR